MKLVSLSISDWLFFIDPWTSKSDDKSEAKLPRQIIKIKEVGK
jgi:hypothetical protein